MQRTCDFWVERLSDYTRCLRWRRRALLPSASHGSASPGSRRRWSQVRGTTRPPNVPSPKELFPRRACRAGCAVCQRPHKRLVLIMAQCVDERVFCNELFELRDGQWRGGMAERRAVEAVCLATAILRLRE